MIDIEEAFERHIDGDEYLKFERIRNPLHPRPDLCAFLMLHNALPGKHDMVCSASQDEIRLDVDCDELAKVATDDFIRDLVRCGVRHDGSLCMFV